MYCGLYGKLPARRDFLSRNVPRAFLNIWEPWIHGGITASKTQFSGEWQSVFDNAPFWRFWLGSEICGETVIGGFIPSVDGIGRAFPLTVFAMAESAFFFPPPVINMQSRWFSDLAVFFDFSRSEEDWEGALKDRLEALPFPKCLSPANILTVRNVSDDCFQIPAQTTKTSDILQAIGTADLAKAYARRSFWWTQTTDHHAGQIIIADQLPDPHLFGGFLSGKFESGALPVDFWERELG